MRKMTLLVINKMEETTVYLNWSSSDSCGRRTVACEEERGKQAALSRRIPANMVYIEISYFYDSKKKEIIESIMGKNNVHAEGGL